MKINVPKYYFKRDFYLYLMLLPAIIGFLIFCYWPMFGLIISFQRYNIILGCLKSPWVGFTNFIDFFTDPYFFRLVKNTFLLGFYSFIWGFPIPIIFALFLNEIKNRTYKKVVQSISYLPYFISTVVLVSILRMFINSPDGLINTVLSSMGREPIQFLLEPKYFRTIFIASDIWKNLGWSSIIYLAAISSEDPQLLEAAIVDGANRIQRMWNVTFAAIRPTITVMMLLSLGGILNVSFEKVYLLYTPQTYEVADVLGTYIYRRGLIGLDYSFGSAVGLLNSVVSFILLVIFNYSTKKLNEESLW